MKFEVKLSLMIDDGPVIIMSLNNSNDPFYW